jgi:amino acid transporter
MTMIEVGGLLAVVAAGLPDLPPAGAILSDLPARLAQFDPAAVIAGAFLSFFAYIGFENLANMAEEAREGERTLPTALLLSLAVSTALYVLVAAVAAGSTATGDLPAEDGALLLGIGARSPWFSADAFAAVALVAVSNGVLIEILMLSRLLYGMARRGWLPAWLGTVHKRTATPLPATLLAGAAVYGLSISFDTAFLAGTTSAITLVVFTVVGGALWRLKQAQPRRSGFAVPGFVPPLAVALCLGLALAQLLLA